MVQEYGRGRAMTKEKGSRGFGGVAGLRMQIKSLHYIFTLSCPDPVKIIPQPLSTPLRPQHPKRHYPNGY